MLNIVARMIVKEDCIEEFKATAKELVEKSRAEEGNIFYALNQHKKDPKLFAFMESWKDKDALKLHNATEHFTGIFPKLAALCEEALPVEMFNEIEF